MSKKSIRCSVRVAIHDRSTYSRHVAANEHLRPMRHVVCTRPRQFPAPRDALVGPQLSVCMTFGQLRSHAGTEVQNWTRAACSRACCVLISRLRLACKQAQGLRLTGLLTGLLPLIAVCILKPSYVVFWGSNEVALRCSHFYTTPSSTPYHTFAPFVSFHDDHTASSSYLDSHSHSFQ